MNVEIITTPNFERAFKKLHRKYRSLLDDFDVLEEKLLTNPHLGTALGNDAYKIRLAVKSKGRGKSGGLRVITYVEMEIIVLENEEEEHCDVYLLVIYDKSNTESVAKSEILQMIKNIKSDD
ncbi:MAG: hypothetical protein R3E32_07575 [Chitinophagales bacterium]